MIQLGLIGCGKNGAGNIEKLVAHSGRCRLAAAADLNAELAKAVVAESGDAETRVVSDFHEFLDEVDAVVISSPNFLHAEQAIACAEAGKHVWIEKPMALSLAEADAICEAVRKSGVHSFVGFSIRFNATPRTLAAQFAAGEIGDLVSIWSRRLIDLKRSGWRREFAKSGGVMSELIAHEIDWLTAITGMPESVYCRVQADEKEGLPKDPRDNDYVWMTFGLPGGATGTIEGAQNAPFSEFYRGIVGSTGSVCEAEHGQKVYHYHAPKEREEVSRLERLDKHGHFLDVLEGRTQSMADAQRGREIVAITEKALESAVSGEAVSLKGVIEAV